MVANPPAIRVLPILWLISPRNLSAEGLLSRESAQFSSQLGPMSIYNECGVGQLSPHKMRQECYGCVWFKRLLWPGRSKRERRTRKYIFLLPIFYQNLMPKVADCSTLLDNRFSIDIS